MPIKDNVKIDSRAMTERTRERSMKKRLLGLTLGVAVLASQVIGAPRLTLPQSEFDFGFVPQNSSIAHVFWLHSAGDDSLRIVSVQPG